MILLAINFVTFCLRVSWSMTPASTYLKEKKKKRKESKSGDLAHFAHSEVNLAWGWKIGWCIIKSILEFLIFLIY